MTHFNETTTALQALDMGQLDRLLSLICNCTGTIWVCGNGGSMSTAQHWACDLSKAAGRRAVALGSNPALLTALANDIAYEDVFSIELREAARPGDILVCLSCSGESGNIAYAIYTAQSMKVPCALLTRLGWQATDLYHPISAVVRIPSDDYGVIEDCHLAIGHWLTKELRHGQ